MFSHKATGLLFAFAASAVTAVAQGSETAWQLIGQIGGPMQAVAAQGKYAYVGVGQRLTVLNVSDPTNPVEMGSSAPFADFVSDIVVNGTVAYVAAGGAGLQVLDVSNPASPAVVGSMQTRGYAEGVAVAGTTVCLADGPYGLRVVDVSNPANPTEIGSAFTRNYAFKVAMAGNYAYVAAGGAGLLIADLTNPAKPVQVATLSTPGYAYGLAVSGNVVYVAGGWDGVAIVDITTPAAPRLLGQYSTGGWAKSVSVSGSQAYVAAALDGLLVVDVSNPAAPAEVGSLAVVGGDAAGVAVAGTIAYVADRNWGLEVVNVSAPAHPVQAGFYGPMGYADGVTAAGNYAYVAAGNYGLRIVDISNPAQPWQVGAFDTQSYGKSVAVAGNYAYVGTQGTQGGLYVLDVSNPTHATQAAFLPGHTTRDLTLAGGIVYIPDEHGLWLVDVSSPTAPKQLSYLQIQTSGGQDTAIGLAVSGTVAYVDLENAGLMTIDLSNPSAPAVLEQFQWPNASSEHVTVSQGNAYVADGNVLTVVDVSNPQALVRLASYPTLGNEESLTLAGSQVFVANGGAGLTVVDVSNPSSPAVVWSYRASGYTESVFVNGNLAIVANLSGGLSLLAKPGTTDVLPGAAAALTGTDAAHAIASTVTPPRVGTGVKPAASARALPVQTASSCIVTSTADSGAGTLRNCLANAKSGTTVTFDTGVFPTSNPATIAPLSTLPGLAQGYVTIDASNAGVILDGGPGGAIVCGCGLFISSDGNSIKGLQIVHFSDDGIALGGTASNNTIGGSRSRGSGPLGEGNLISGNGGAGINTNGSQVTNTTVTGNFIGTDITGTASMGSQSNGIFLFNSSNNMIGGSGADERNVISGNSSVGVNILGSGSAGNSVLNNYIGVDASGTKALSDGEGVTLEDGASGNLVQGNVIVGSNFNTIVISDWGSSYNTIVGNLVGTDANGESALGSAAAMWVGMDASFNRIGGATPAERNVLNGIVTVTRYAGPGNLFIGNFVGTDVTGAVAIGTYPLGIQLDDGANRPFIGGTTAGERNVIGRGINVGDVADFTFIGGNYLGTDASGQVALSNGSGGVGISASTHTIVQGNLITHASQGAGVSVSGYSGNTIRQNLIYSDQGGGIVLSNGANAGISSPVIASVSVTGVSGTACPGCEVEIFSDSGDEGQIFEGSVIAGVSGAFTFNEGNPLTGPNITATATDLDGNTSRFSASAAAVPLATNPPPDMAVAPSTLQFAYFIGGAIPEGQPIQVTKTGGGEFNWSASSNAPWLSATPASDMTPSTVAVSAAPGSLTAGTYNGSITISADGIAPQTVAVNFQVTGTVCEITPGGNIGDVQRIVNEALGVMPANNDLNGDGVVNVTEVQIVINACKTS